MESSENPSPYLGCGHFLWPSSKTRNKGLESKDRAGGKRGRRVVVIDKGEDTGCRHGWKRSSIGIQQHVSFRWIAHCSMCGDRVLRRLAPSSPLCSWFLRVFRWTFASCSRSVCAGIPTHSPGPTLRPACNTLYKPLDSTIFSAHTSWLCCLLVSRAFATFAWEKNMIRGALKQAFHTKFKIQLLILKNHLAFFSCEQTTRRPSIKKNVRIAVRSDMFQTYEFPANWPNPATSYIYFKLTLLTLFKMKWKYGVFLWRHSENYSAIQLRINKGIFSDFRG